MSQPLGRLFRLGWPLILAEQVSLLVSIMTVLWIGRLIGPSGLATEAMLRPILMSIGLVFFAVAIGGAVLTARSVGAKDGNGLTLIAATLALTLVSWVVLGVVLGAIAVPAAGWLASDRVRSGDLLAYFLPWLLVGLPSVAIVQVLVTTASAAGWTKVNLIRIASQLVVAAIIIPVFITTLGLGLSGVAFASLVQSAVIGVLIWSQLKRSRAKWNLGDRVDRAKAMDRKLWRQLLDIGLPPQLVRISVFVGQSLLVQVVRQDGSATVSGYGIAFLLLLVGAGASAGLSQAGGIMIAQALGARDHATATRSLRVAFLSSVVIGLVTLGIVELIADVAVTPFTGDPGVRAEAARALRIMALALPAIAGWQLLLAAIAAAKATRRAGVYGLFAEVPGVVFGFMWPGDRLVGVTLGVCLANVLRLGLFAVLARRVLTPESGGR